MEEERSAAPPSVPFAAVILAGGSGTRAGGTINKVLLSLDGSSVLSHSVRTALSVPGLRRLLVVVREEDRAAVADDLAPHLGAASAQLVAGGETRHGSETAALAALRAGIAAGDFEVVVMHDAARPLASARLWREVVERAAAAGGAVPVLDATDVVSPTTWQPVSGQVAVQTPQAFRAEPILAAYDAAAGAGFAGSDTASCLEAFRPEVVVLAVPGERRNLKITWPGDAETAQALKARAG